MMSCDTKTFASALQAVDTIAESIARAFAQMDRPIRKNLARLFSTGTAMRQGIVDNPMEMAGHFEEDEGEGEHGTDNHRRH
jgi:hypothetical protein